MFIKRRTALRWGLRAGALLAYLTDPKLGAKRREEMLVRLELLGGRTRAAPLIRWLQALNAGRVEPPPTAKEMGVTVRWPQGDGSARTPTSALK